MHRWLASNRSQLRAILQYLDTPRSLSTWLLLENKEWDQLATQWVDPQHYPEGVFSALAYRKDVQAVDLLRKAPLPTTFSRRDAAFTAWENAEIACAVTNNWLNKLLSSGASPTEWRLAQFLRQVQSRMSRWLGPLPADLDGGFGPGTCVEYVGTDPTVVDKLWLTPTTTPEAAPYFSVLYGRSHWGTSRTQAGLAFLGTSRGNRLTTVPKDGKTDRPISIEPLGNLWLQLGIGRYFKKRLELIGLRHFSSQSREIIPKLVVGYEDPQSLHRRLARSGRTRGLSTLDLSSASDMVSKELVRWVFPPDWYSLMDDCRSKHTLLPKAYGGGWRYLEKFSSMGNGFTFEMETLLFLGLLSVACNLTPGVDIWVFGDDIIVPTECFDLARSVLEVFGFKVNTRKSYRDGPFRESCGGHYHSDLDVNPIRLKAEVDDLPNLIALHNGLLRWGIPFPVLRGLRNAVPLKYRIFGPERLGDVVLHGGPYKTVFRRGCHWVRTIKFKSCDPIPLDRWSPEMSMTAILLGVGPRIARRHSRVSPALGWTSVS